MQNVKEEEENPEDYHASVRCDILFHSKLYKITENEFIELKSPTIACSTLENFNNMVSFSENKDFFLSFSLFCGALDLIPKKREFFF